MITTGALPTGQAKGWLATFVIAALMLGVVGSGFLAAMAVANVPDKPVVVGGGVVVAVPAEWSYAGRTDDGKTAVLTRGSASIGITFNAGTTAAAALKALHDEWASLGTVAVGDVSAATDVRGGSAGNLRFAYSGTFPAEQLPGPVEGEVTAVPSSNGSVVFDAWAAKGQYQTVRGDVLSIIDTTTIP